MQIVEKCIYTIHSCAILNSLKQITTRGKEMEIGAQVKVKLASGEWYSGVVVAKKHYSGSDIRLEVHGNKPRPFVTITSESSLRAI